MAIEPETVSPRIGKLEIGEVAIEEILLSIRKEAREREAVPAHGASRAMLRQAALALAGRLAAIESKARSAFRRKEIGEPAAASLEAALLLRLRSAASALRDDLLARAEWDGDAKQVCCGNTAWRRFVDAIESAALAEAPAYRHRKRGTLYKVIGRGELQSSRPVAEGDLLVAYVGEDGRLWLRPEAEFEDGRFDAIGKARG